jgi:two-component system chemotaxis response regulator CheB
MTDEKLVLIGASWGGLEALRKVLGGLPAGLPAAVVIAQHRSPESHPNAFRDLLGAVTPLEVCEASEKQPLQVGTVFLAPPDYHTLVEGDHLALSVDGPVSFARPSIDVLLESGAESYGDRSVGVILTGANADGARGLARVAALGGAAVVQDPATADRAEMPAAALAAVPDAHVAPLEDLAALLVDLCARKAVV